MPYAQDGHPAEATMFRGRRMSVTGRMVRGVLGQPEISAPGVANRFYSLYPTFKVHARDAAGTPKRIM
jgi:hypothetical protein